ncbi:MAG: CHAT domain-containing tetratricopeptide repeat protein [Blastomonas sp.]
MHRIFNRQPMIRQLATALAGSAALTLASIPSGLCQEAEAGQAEQPAPAASPYEDLSQRPPAIRAMNAEDEKALRIAGYSLNSEIYDSRRKAWETAVEIFSATYGPDHPRTHFARIRLAEHLVEYRRYDEAEALLDAASAYFRREAPLGHPARFATLTAQRLLYLRQDKLDRLVPVLDAIIAEAAAQDAVLQPAISTAPTWLGLRAEADGDYREAERQHRLYLDSLIASGTTDPAALAYSAEVVARMLLRQGRYREAKDLLEPYYDQAVAAEKPDPDLVWSLGETMGEVSYNLYHFARSDAAFAKARELRKDDEFLNSLRSSATRMAVKKHELYARDKLISITFGDYMDRGEFSRMAEPDDFPEIRDDLGAAVVSAGASAYETRLKAFDDTEEMRRKVLQWFEQQLGPDHPKTSAARRDLAENLLGQWKPFAAEPLIQQAIAAQRKVLGVESVDVGLSLLVFAKILAAEGRRDEAYDTAESAAGVLGAVLGPQDFRTRQAVAFQAEIAALIGRKQQAGVLWQSLLDGFVLDPDVGSLTYLKQMFGQFQGGTRYQIDNQQCPSIAENEPLAKQLEELKKLTNDRELIETGYVILSEVYACHGRYAEAAAYYEQSQQLIGLQASLSADEFAVQKVRLVRAMLGNKAGLRDTGYGSITGIGNANGLSGTLSFAEDQARRLYLRRSTGSDSTDTIRARSRVSGGGRDLFDFVFATRLMLDWSIHEARDGSGPIKAVNGDSWKINMSFMAAQDMERASAARVLAQSAARLSTGDGPLAGLLREQQTLSDELVKLERRLTAASISSPLVPRGSNEDDSGRIQDRIGEVTTRLGEIDKAVLRDFPDYFAYAAPSTPTILDTQQAMASDEAVLLIRPSEGDVHVFLITRWDAAWHRVKGAAAEVDRLVAGLRCDLDPETCNKAGPDSTRGGMRSTGSAAWTEAEIANWIGYGFDRNAAWRLYDMLIAPIADVMDQQNEYLPDVRKIYTVASGSIASLPLGVLLTEKPADNGTDAIGAVFRDAPWLANRYTLVTLPSVASLQVRAPPPVQEASLQLSGYGDPVLADAQTGSTTARSGLGVFSATRDVTRADPGEIRKLKSLPGSRRELNALAELFGPENVRLSLSTDATEGRIKRDTDISHARNIIFSTHGVLPGDLGGIAEPGLVLTPPSDASDMDDGLLVASEAAELKLDADLLILSACNTATADSEGGSESLSSLARSFIYAGARGIYASHWRVSDDATAALMVTALSSRKAGLSRGDALAAAQRTVRTGLTPDGGPLPDWNPDWSHPSYWAPFVIISGSDAPPEEKPAAETVSS